MGNPYLVFYNTSLCLMWGFILYLVVDIHFVKHGSTEDVYQAVEVLLKVAQTSAIMEIIHSMLGIVRSPVMITATQVASRLWVLWGLIVPVPGPTTTGALVLGKVGGFTLQLNLVTLLLAWCSSEVIRYSFFALKELLPSVPYVSLWLRYSGFIVLYPLGVSSELTMAYLAMPTIRATSLWSFSMPNKINFGFDYWVVCWIIIATYLPGLPQLYGYMLVQRRKQLGGKSGKDKDSGLAAAGAKAKAN